MKKALLNTLIALFLLPAAVAFGQGKVFISKNVLKTAEWAGFKYNDVLKKSLTGDQPSIMDFVKFHAVVDGVEGVEHGVSCLELIPLVGDQTFGSSILLTKPKLKSLLLKRLVLAQAKTKKTELKKPVESWAPISWAILNGLPMPQSEMEKAQKAHKAKHADSPDGPANNTGTVSPSAAPSSSRQ